LLKYAAVAELKAGRTVRAPEATPPPAATRGPPGKSKQPKAKGRDKDDEGGD